jgi:hypothetical protein
MPHDGQHKWNGLVYFCIGRMCESAKISAHGTQPERLRRRAEELVAGGLKAAEMNAVRIA